MVVVQTIVREEEGEGVEIEGGVKAEGGAEREVVGRKSTEDTYRPRCFDRIVPLCLFLSMLGTRVIT